jgi:hypothetical protein
LKTLGRIRIRVSLGRRGGGPERVGGANAMFRETHRYAFKLDAI